MTSRSSSQSSKASKRWSRRQFLARLTSSAGVVVFGVPSFIAGTCHPSPRPNSSNSNDNTNAGQSRESVEEPVPGREPVLTEQTMQEPGVGPEPQASDGGLQEVLLREPTPEIPSKQEPFPEPQRCALTEDNIEGPYYRENAPWKTRLGEANEPGVPLRISGVVMDASCQPIPDAIVDVWQANNKGSYDNDGQNDPPNQAFHMRGRMKTNAKGEYAYDTVVPGRYLNGDTYRPSHIHYKVYAPGYQTLTTQLYFAGDPYIKGDAFVRPSLVITLKGANQSQTGEFSIVLSKKA